MIRRFARIAAASAALLMAGALLTASPVLAQGVGLDLGTQAPAVALEDLDGNPVDLGQYVGQGTPALIEFWASWCENCEALQPQLDQIAAEHGDAINIVAVAVAVSQSQRRVRRHMEEHGATYPYLWDGKGAAVRAYNAATTSIVMLVDGDGTVVYSGVGGQQDLVSEVAKLLGDD
jgi:thiol-disulfide isomerase/thioredoxin